MKKSTAKAGGIITGKLKGTTLDRLALSIALPHEHRPQRFPILPVAWTGLLPFMNEFSIRQTLDWGVERKYVLTRDPAYPFWGEVPCDCFGVVTEQNYADFGAEGGSLTTPDFSTVRGVVPTTLGAGFYNAGNISPAEVSDLAVFGVRNGANFLYLPMGAIFCIEVSPPNDSPPTNPENAHVEVPCITYRIGHEEGFTAEAVWYAPLGKYVFSIDVGANVPNIGRIKGNQYSGQPPYVGGFVRATGAEVKIAPDSGAQIPVFPTGAAALAIGWLVAASPVVTFAELIDSGARSLPTLLMMPLVQPPEFTSSKVPYERVRANATSALLTNVTQVLAKSGTMLAGRLRPETVDFYDFTKEHIDSVAAPMRYYGAAEKGIYSFTTPSVVNGEQMVSAVTSIQSFGVLYGGNYRPAFTAFATAYNAIIASPTLDSEFAVTVMRHLEFETNSALFTLGVSTAPIEALHAVELALIQVGYFHENPLHLPALGQAISAAFRIAAPHLIPAFKSAGSALMAAGVDYLANRFSQVRLR